MMNKCIPKETPRVKSKINLIRERTPPVAVKTARPMVKHGQRTYQGEPTIPKVEHGPVGSGRTSLNYVIFINIITELISSMGKSISIGINAQSTSSISKPKERNMISYMFNIIFYFNYILTYITTIF